MAETQLWTIVGTIAAILAALFGGVAAWNGIVDRRERRRLADERAAACWQAIVEDHRGRCIVQLRYEPDGSPQVYLDAVTIVAPRRARLRDFKWAPDPIDDAFGGHVPVPTTVHHHRTLQIRRDIDFEDYFGGTGLVRRSYGSVSLMVELPSRPWYARSSTTRLRIAVQIEERSANRRATQIIVTTEKLAWSASIAHRKA